MSIYVREEFNHSQYELEELLKMIMDEIQSHDYSTCLLTADVEAIAEKVSSSMRDEVTNFINTVIFNSQDIDVVDEYSIKPPKSMFIVRGE